jgi:hypothetical protein
MQRTATCACEQLSITVEGDPRIVATCSCIQCQKRTGSAFGVSSYFRDKQVLETRGEFTTGSRTADSGHTISGNFCPRCGSTVFWKGDFILGHTGIAVGCFGDPDFPQPTAAAWCATKHSWVDFPEHWKHSDTQDFS